MRFADLPRAILTDIFLLGDQKTAIDGARICSVTCLPAVERLFRHLEINDPRALRHVSHLARHASDSINGRL